MQHELGAAVIGVGMYGQVHARIYASDPRTKLVTVWSRSRERAQAVAKRFGCEWTTDLVSIAEDKRIDLVSIATPDFAHTEPAVQMLEAGKHSLIEKPMATSQVECERILQTARRADRKLMVNFHNRWYPPIAEAKRRIEKGELGAPVCAFARLSDTITIPTQWLSWAGKSGPQWFLLPHTVDLTRWLFDQEAISVYALGRKGVLKSRGIDCYDVVQAQIQFERAMAILESSWILPPSWRNEVIEFRVDLYGEKGRIGIIGDNEGIEISTDGHRTPLLYDFVTEAEPIRYFVRCILEDEDPVPSGQDGLTATKIIQAICESMEKGKPMKVGRA